jgi:hypothetical protein
VCVRSTYKGVGVCAAHMRLKGQEQRARGVCGVIVEKH